MRSVNLDARQPANQHQPAKLLDLAPNEHQANHHELPRRNPDGTRGRHYSPRVHRGRPGGPRGEAV